MEIYDACVCNKSAVRQNLNLELTKRRNVFTPMASRRLIDLKGFGNRVVAAEIAEYVFCLHGLYFQVSAIL